MIGLYEKFDLVFNLRICICWKHLKWIQLAPIKFSYKPIATTIQTTNHFKTTLPIGDTSISIGNLYKQRFLAFVVTAKITLLYFNFIWSFSIRAFNNSSHYILIFFFFWVTNIYLNLVIKDSEYPFRQQGSLLMYLLIYFSPTTSGFFRKNDCSHNF